MLLTLRNAVSIDWFSKGLETVDSCNEIVNASLNDFQEQFKTEYYEVKSFISCLYPLSNGGEFILSAFNH